MFWDRRKKERRGKSGKDAPQEDRRAQSEKSERRKWACGILYKTSIPVTELEAWLDANAEGEWAVALEGMGEELSSKVLKIMFEDADDKQAFIDAFSRRQR